jgi:DNA-binding IclR family transcriptional regulator
MLSPKQYEVWKHISDVGEAAPGDIVKATGIALGTVRQALNSLVEHGKVKRVGRGRGTRYQKI